MTDPQSQLSRWIGSMDIYLLDQLLKGNLQPGMRLLDAGFGHGRNLHFFLQAGYEVWGMDPNPEYVLHVQKMAAMLSPGYPAERFQCSSAEAYPGQPEYFDAVILSAVLHFAQNPGHAWQILQRLWEMLAPGGLLFVRCASDIGMAPEQLHPLGEGRYLLPDGTERFLATQTMIEDWAAGLKARPVEPLKTTLVASLRAMTTWVWMKVD